MSNIEWTDETWNPVVGCTRASRGCDNCYAVTMTHRLEAMGQSRYAGLTVLNGRGDRHFNGVVRTVPEALDKPLKWRKPRMVFVNSMADLFHEAVPFEFIDRVFAVMALCPQHTFQVLTKRPERMAEYLLDGDPEDRVYNRAMDLYPGNISESADFCEEHVQKWPLPNVWLGTSVEDQAAAAMRIPELLRCPAAVRFLSCEPLLGAVDLRLDGELLTDLMDASGDRSPDHRGRYPFAGLSDEHRTKRKHWLHWVIVGGESGARARPCDVAWLRSIVEQCREAGVPVFVKQLGERPRGEWDPDGPCLGIWGPEHKPKDRKGGDLEEWPEDLRVREMPGASHVFDE